MNRKISRPIILLSGILILFSLLNGCTNPNSEFQETKAERLSKEKKHRLLSTISALPKDVKSPKDNPIYTSKVELGRLLFFDPILSGDKDVACATCHHPENGYAEFRDISIGVNGIGFGSKRTFNKPNDIPFVKRNAHTILNTAYNGIDILNKYNPKDAPMFWDSRVNSLEEQALEPLKALEEMRGRNFSEDEILDKIVERLKSNTEYQALFSDNIQRNPEVSTNQYDPLVKELNLRVRDMASIINFLNTLNESNFDKQIPEVVPSGLPVGGNIY